MTLPEAKFMQAAIDEATNAIKENRLGIGAVIVCNGKIIATGSNRTHADNSPIAHAEVMAITAACKALNSRHLENCELYTTHEPCSMCASAAVYAKLGAIIFGATNEDMNNWRNNPNRDPKFGWRTIEISPEQIIAQSNEDIEVIRGYMRDQCIKLFR